MSQPTPYTPTTDFSDDELNNVAGRSTVDTAALDAELAAVEITLDQILVNIALNQRDDGEIRDLRVKLHTLGTDVVALLATTGCVVRGAWLTATVYAPKDIVTESGTTYIAAVAHTSGTFATDLAAVKWLQISSPTTAANIPIVDAAGKFTATNVEAALAELADATGVDVADAGGYFTGTTVEAALAELGLRNAYIHLRDQKADGTQGGASSAATVHTRTLNTEVTDTHNLCALAANQFTLTAGTYRIAASAPCMAGGDHRAFLYNVTGAATLIQGENEYSGLTATETVQTRSWVRGQFTVAAGQALELRHYINAAQGTNGLGAVSNGAGVEVYAQVELWRIS